MDTDLDQLLYILENCSKHHRPEVVAFLRDIRVIVHFLPPYSPDLNPIEEAFPKVKTTEKFRSTNYGH